MQNARLDGIRMLTLGCAIFLVIGFLWEPHWPSPMADFQAVYVASRAMLQHTDPYQSANILQQLRETAPAGTLAQRTPRQMQVALVCINLPTTLSLLALIALIPWSCAHILWMTLTASLFILAASLIWDLCAPHAPLAAGCAAGFVVANSILMLTGGNTAGVVISLTLIAAWCFLRDRFTLCGALCMGLALAIKPQDVGLIWLYFLIAGSKLRRRALQALVVFTTLAIPSAIWMFQVAPGWPHELQANLALASSKGQLNDPGPTSVTHLSLDMPIHLQTIFSVFKDHPSFYNTSSYLLCGALLLLWVAITLRSRRNERTSLLALATVTPLSLLPTYHRLYDAPLVLLVLPAFSVLWSQRDALARWTLAVLSVALVCTGDFPLIVWGALTRGSHFSTSGLANQVKLVFLARPATLALLALSAFMLSLYALRAFGTSAKE